MGIIEKLHICNGRHLPKNEHIAKVSSMFFWDSVKEKVSAYVEKCFRCKLNKISVNTKPLKQRVNTILSSRPLERVQFDLIKIPALYSCNYKFIMTAKDHFSRMAWAYLLENKSAASTSKCLAEFLDEWTPEKVQTDNGAEFKGAFDRMLEEKKIPHIRGRPYHPESQGSVEAFNKYLKQEIPKYLSSFEKTKVDLPEVLRNFLNNYNFFKPHSATGIIPHTLFIEKNPSVLEKVAKKLKEKQKYQKQFYSANKGSRIFILSCFRDTKGKMMYVKTPKKEVEIVGLGTLVEDYNQGYVEVQIEKWFGEHKNYSGIMLLDPKICIPISEVVFQGLLATN